MILIINVWIVSTGGLLGLWNLALAIGKGVNEMINPVT